MAAMKRLASGGQALADTDAVQDASVDPAVVLRKLNRHLVPWLFMLGVMCYLDRTSLSFAALQLNRDLHLSCSTYGLGAALFFISYALFQVPSTVACARLGAPVWLSANIIAWGAVAASFSLADGVPVFLALRFLLGATESAAFPGMWYHLTQFYSESELGPAYAKVSSCTALAQVLGAPLAAAILSLDGAAGLRGWQWLFLLEGAATVVFGVVLRFVLAPSPARARILTRAERQWLQQRQDRARAAARQQQQRDGGGSDGGGGSGGDGGGGKLRQQFKGILGVIRDWRILWLSASWLFIAAVMFGMTFFMPLLVAAMFSAGAASPGGHHGGSCGGGGGGASSSVPPAPGAAAAGGLPQQQGDGEAAHTSLVALATAIPFIMAAIGMNINARLAQRANERHRHAGVPILLAGLTLGLVPVAMRLVGPAPAFVLLSLAAGFCWSFHGPFFSWPAVFLSGEQAAAGFALINSLGAVGGFIGPFLIGLLTDRGASAGGGAFAGFGAAMSVLAGFLLLSGTLILFFPAPGHREPEVARGKGSGSGGDDGSSDEESGGGSGGSGGEAGFMEQRERLKGIGGSSGGSGSGGGKQSELECQPILGPAARSCHV